MRGNQKIIALGLLTGAFMLSNSFIIQGNAQSPFEGLNLFGNIGVGQHIQEIDRGNKVPVIFGTHLKHLDSNSPLVEIRTMINDDNGVKEANVHYSTDNWATDNVRRLNKTVNQYQTQILLQNIENLAYYIEATDVQGLTTTDPKDAPKVSYQDNMSGSLHSSAPLSEPVKSRNIYYHNREGIQSYNPLRDSRNTYYISRYEFLNLILKPLEIVNETGKIDTSFELATDLGLTQLWSGKYEPLSYVGRLDAVLMMLQTKQIKEGLEHLSFQNYLNTLKDEATKELTDILVLEQTPKFESALWANQSSKYVGKVKTALNALGYEAGEGYIYDNQLRTAITNFQIDQDLIKSLGELRAGRFDNPTRMRLNEIMIAEETFVYVKIDYPHTLLPNTEALRFAEKILDI